LLHFNNSLQYKQYNCNLIERSLQSSEVHIEAEQSSGFSSTKLLRTLGWCEDRDLYDVL